MDSIYDENLNENSFFQTLQSDYYDLFQKAVLEGWIICVPRSGSVPKYVLTVEDFFSHVLIPSDELPGSHFRTANDKDVRILNRVITVEQGDIIPPYSTHILFEETFYTEDLVKYKVLCIDNPLEPCSELCSSLRETGRNVVVHTLRDCIDFLWTESAGKRILEEIDSAVKNFNDSSKLDFETLQSQKDCVSSLYVKCLQIALQDHRLKENASKDQHFLEALKLSVETYMHHGIYLNLIKCISACTAYEDANLNKIVRNLSDIQLRDFDIRTDLYDAVIPARQELARLDRYSTPLGKIGCIKRMVMAISKQSTFSKSKVDQSSVVATDDLLSMMVFLVIRTNLPNWIAQLTYMKQFHLSARVPQGGDEFNFLVTSLEAAIEHVKSGILLGPLTPESQMTYEDSFESEQSSDNIRINISSINYFFDQVRKGNSAEVKNILAKVPVPCNANDIDKQGKFSDVNTSSLCHPLCSCLKCEQLVSKKLCDVTPTVHSHDDRGFTALHVACLFGDVIIVDILIQNGANVDATDLNGSTPLHFAAAKGHQNAVLSLIHFGAKMNVSDSDGNTPLHFASNNGHEDCVKALLYFAEHMNLKINTNASNNNGDTPLHHASRWGYVGIVEILLEHGANPNIENKRHLTPLSCAHNVRISKLLKECAREIKDIDSFVVVPFLKSDVKKSVPQQQLDFSDRNENKCSNTDKCSDPVLQPKSVEELKTVEKLLKAVAIGDIQLASYYLGLEKSVGMKEPKISVKVLCHPLCACESCKVSDQESDDSSDEIRVDFAMKRIVLNINVCNPDGFTSLHIAALWGQVEIVKLLLDNGAQLNLKTRVKGETPLHLACQKEQLQVVKLLVQSGDCNLDIVDHYGNTPLHYCCRTGNPRLVSFLLKYEPLLNVKNSDGNTPLDEAEERLYFTVVKLLKGRQKILPLEI